MSVVEPGIVLPPLDVRERTMTHRDFEAFYRDSHARVVRSLTLAIGNADAAWDAAQEGFERAYRRWRTVRVADRPEAWVYVVAMRHHVRMRRRTSAGVPRSTDSVVQPPDVLRAIMVDEALVSLTPRQREMVVLRFHADLPVKVIAKAMGCAEGTVKATLHQALHSLRIEFEDEDLT